VVYARLAFTPTGSARPGRLSRAGKGGTASPGAPTLSEGRFSLASCPQFI